MSAAQPAQAQAPAPDRRPELGLALSGGGFRAAFFHVGVLARLAETGTLRRVEVISTVSGGSIVGALYYLALKDLFENVADADIRDEHYLRVVRRVERMLFDGVGRNLRGRAYANLSDNVRMRLNTYSRSDRIGQLYDESFYTPVWNESEFGEHPAPRVCEGPIRMRELVVHPKGAPAGFEPRRDNGRRAAPVPVLLLNATSLNTGHNWRFKVDEMGEDPRSGKSWIELDKNKRLLSARYEQIVEHQQDFKLGNAVAASACVPGLFPPLAVTGLFSGVQVQLVDGGVHDNQGVCGLFDEGCKRLIVSDASGQMGDFDHPFTRIPAVLGRSTSIHGDRVREEQLNEALTRDDTVLMHLRKGLPAWGYSPLLAGGKPAAKPTESKPPGYDVDPEVQKLLAAIRTDLDSFTEVEAYSLSLLGYLMTRTELPEGGRLAYEWQLDKRSVELLRAELRDPKQAYRRQLEVAHGRFFKAAKLSRLVRALAVGVGLVVLAALAFVGLLLSGPASGDVPAWSLIVALVVPALFVGLYFKQKLPGKTLYRFADWLYTWLLPLVLAPLFWIASRAVLPANRRFLAAGEISRVAAADGVEAGAGVTVVQT